LMDVPEIRFQGFSKATNGPAGGGKGSERGQFLKGSVLEL